MNPSFRIFIGYDSREKIAFHVLSYSIMANATIPVSITPINLNNLKRFYNRPRGKKESTEFSISRFLTPYLSDYQGYSLYLDCDFIVLGDVLKLIEFVKKDSSKAVWCVKHSYIPKDRSKFLKEKQFIYAKKNWSSFMVFNNKKCKILTPKFVSKAHGLDLHQFKWTREKLIGALPKNWNILVGEEKIPNKFNAIHYTLGGPYFKEYSKCDGSKFWFKYEKQIFEK